MTDFIIDISSLIFYDEIINEEIIKYQRQRLEKNM